MSDFSDMMVEMLPVNSQLQKKDNPVRVVLDRTVGAYMDTFEIPYEQIFLTSATGGWLDAHGKDYGIPRRIDEDDEHYRQRIIYEKLDHLTPALLSDVYNVKLFTFRGDFNVDNNTLVSDNPHIVMNESFLGTSDEDTISILDKKFIVDSTVTWINNNGEIEYILDTRGKNILSNYSKIYTSQDIYGLCKLNTTIQKVKLKLPVANDCKYLFLACTSLENVNLILPNATDCEGMFQGGSSLVNVDLDLPNTNNCERMFRSCSQLVNVDLNLPNADNCEEMFRSCSQLVNIDLDLTNATNCMGMFIMCSALTDVNLSLPNATSCQSMFFDCSALTNVKLNLPNLSNYEDMFYSDSNIETIDVTIPTNKVSGFKSYVTGLNLQHLTSFIINGEEQL